VAVSDALMVGVGGVEAMRCPKCGFEQDEGAECLACGVIFGKLRATRRPAPPSPPPPSAPAPSGTPSPARVSEVESKMHEPAMPVATLPDVYDGAPLPPPAAAGSVPFRLRVMHKPGVFDVLGQTFEVVARNPLWFLIVFLVSLLGELLSVPADGSFGVVVGLALSLVAFGVAASGAVAGAYRSLRRERVELDEVLGVSVRAAPRSLWVTLMVTVLLTVGTAAAAFPGVLVTFLIIGVPHPLALLPVLPVFLFGLASFAVAIPAAVDGKLGAWASLRRSWVLSSGFRWVIAGILVATAVANFGVSYLIGVDGGGIAGAAAILWDAVAGVFGMTLLAVLYYRLRSCAETLRVHELESRLLVG